MSKTLYASYPELATDRVFTPAEVGLLAGVSPEKQRQYRLAKNAFTVFLEEREDSKHARYDWEDVALWALFAEVASYGFDLKSAGYFAASFSGLKNLPKPEGIEAIKDPRQILFHDFRVEQGDREAPLYILCFPQVGRPESFINTHTRSGGVVFDGSGLFARRFGFWVNYSDFQRRLLLRYDSIRQEASR